MHHAAFRSGYHLAAGPLTAQLAADAPRAARAAQGLFARVPSTWSAEADVQQKIANRLGWLGSPQLMADSLDRIRAFAGGVRSAGITDVVLLGMGGSSLAPAVLRAILGIRPGWPRLHLLDSTDPGAIRAATTRPSTTLYLLSSKSGTTIEPNLLAAHFQRALQDAGIARWAEHFVAITDAGTELARRAKTEGFRDVFINPSDIGGRFSALSFFGMVPAALMGQDVEALIRWGLAMLDDAQMMLSDAETNPAVGLGLFMGAGARAGRDKLTLIVPPALEEFGLWVEQLVAESTGKHGVGIVPIAGEPLGASKVYGRDRLFVRLRSGQDGDEERRDAAVDQLSPSPVLTLDFPEPAALGAEFVRWEIATAIAGALLGVNPFDEPNVQQAKDATNVLLDRQKTDGTLPLPAVDASLPGGGTLTLSDAARNALGQVSAEELLRLVRPGDYVGILAYLGPDPAAAEAAVHFRIAVRDRLHAATMFGYGPRYLHSTGQLHKGGPNTGVFVLVSATPAADLDIPGQRFSFGTLQLAQALGDFNSLDTSGRRAVHVHLGSPDPALLRSALDTLIAHVTTGG
jgi:glucose-6-phosphate isomerase